jgi:hypothetical protein
MNTDKKTVNELIDRIIELAEKRKQMEAEIISLNDEILNNHCPFAIGEKVAVVDRESRKFKRWAYVAERKLNVKNRRIDFKLYQEKKDGSASKMIDHKWFSFDESLIKESEANPHDVFVAKPIDISNFKL